MGKIQLEDRVLELYEDCEGNASELYRRLEREGVNTSYQTVYEILKVNGLKAKGRRRPGGRVTSEELERIIELYEECNRYATRACRKLRTEGNYRSLDTIIRIWKKQGFEIQKMGSPGSTKRIPDRDNFTEKDFKRPIIITEKEEKRIIELYKECDGYSKRAEEILENEGNYRHYTTIIKIWREQGFEIRKRGGPKIVEEEERIIKLYEECDGYALRAEKILENEGNYRTRTTIIKIWREKGLEINPKGRPKGSKHNAERDELIAEGLTLQEISKKTGVTRQAIQQYIHVSGQYEKWKEARR